MTVDIVEFSTRSLEEQVIATQALIELLRKAVPEEINNPNRRIWSPAGDGGCLTFWDSTSAAISTAVELGILVNRYNKYIQGKIDCKDVDERIHNDELPRSKEPIRIRSGIHNGPVVKQVDFDERQNIWGIGINLAARVASVAKPDQIVVSEEYYKAADLENREEYKITPIGIWWAKHNIALKLYNVYFQDGHDIAGIPSEEVEEWYTPFQRPLQGVISTYATMLEKERVAYRALVLAKRIMDLCPDEQACEHSGAKQIIKSISNEGRAQVKKVGQESLRDDFFSELSPDALLYFCHHTQFKSFAAGDLICKQGEDAHSMMLVVSGKINLYLKDEHFNDQLVPEVDLGEGHIIGEMGLFNPAGKKRTATLNASKNSITLNLDYSALQPKEVAISSKTRKEITRYLGPQFLRSEENSIIEDIRKQIWRLYCNRTKENQIRTIPKLYQRLNDDQREQLVKNSELLPMNENDPILCLKATDSNN